MPIYSIKAPDGRTYRIEGPEGASQEDIIAHVLDDHPEAATPLKPKTGIGAAIGQGVEQLISSGRTAYGALTGSPEEAAQAGLARGEDIGKRYEDQVSLQKVKDVYAARGILPAAGEAISQIPAAIAQQAPNLASMAGSARLGAMAGSPLGPIGSIVGGVAGAALPSLIQQFGGNVERQASEQQKAGRPISIDVGAAGAAAVPQAGLDVAGNLIPFGGRIITKLTGIPMQALLGRTAAQATKLADEKLLATLSKGIGVGALAEIPTEIAQQMLERAQAGLSLSDADAMKEYGETAYQVGLLAPLGAVGRLSERSGARAEVGQRQDEEKRKTQLEQMQTEADKLNAAEAAKVEAEANKQTPDYAVQFADDHEALQKQYFDLRAQVKKPGPNATAAEQEAYKQSDAQLKALRKQLGQQAAEYLRIKPLAEQERARRAPKAEEAAPETPVPPPGQMEIPGFERGDFTAPEAAPPPEAVDYNQQARVLRARLEELQTQARDTKNLDEKIALGERYSQTEKAALEAEKKAKEAIRPTQQIGMLKRKMAIAEEEGDVAAQVDLAQKLKALGVDDIAAEAQTEMALTPFKGKSETTDAFNKKIVNVATDAARVRTGTVEEEEQAGLEAQRAEQARLDAASAQEKAGIPAPPNFEMVGKPGQQARYDLFGEEEQPSLASAPLGQMKQMLTGEDVTYTAEEEKPRGSLRRAGPAPFNLYPSREGEAEPITRQGIEQRIDRLLLRDDLSPEARELFGRVSRAMPANDTQGALTALDQQLTKIESGEEGIYAEGAGKPVTYEGFPVKGARAEIAAPTEANKTDIETRASAAPGEMRTLAQERRKKYDEGIANGLTHAEASRRAYAGAAVQPEKVERTGVVAGEARKQKIVSEEMQSPAAFAAAKREREAQAAQDRAQGKVPTLQPLGTLRGPSIQPKPLSLRAEIEPFIALSERVAQDTSGQMGLFPESEKESIGAIKPTREAFERFMRSPYVNKLRKDIRDAREKIKAAKSIDALQSQIKALTTRLADIKTAKEGYQSAKELLAANKDIQMASRDIAELHAAATKNIISRMEIDGRIDSLEKQRGELLQEGRAMGESVDPAFLADLNDAISELEDVRNERAILDGALNVLDVQIKLAKAQTQIGDLLSQVPLASQVDELETNLATARQALVEAEAARREIQEKRDAAITEASKAAAVEKQKATTFAQKLSDEQTRIWNTVFSDVGTATRYRALTENEMAKRGYVAPVDAKAADDYGKSLANKSVQILQLERGKIQKELDSATEAVIAAKERSGKYVGGAQNVVTFRGLGRAIRLQAAAAVRLAAIEDALIARAAEEAPRSVMRGTPAVVKTATAQEQAMLDDQVERVNAVGRETEKLESLKTDFASAKAKDKPEIGKKIQAQLLEVAKAEKAANEINARVSRASRVVAGAPSKLRTGSPESKAASGNTSQRVLEGRPVSQPTAKQAVEDANKAAADRLASLQTLTAKERKAALEKLTVAQENDLLAAANRKWEDAGTQLNNVRDRLAGLRQINIDFKEGKRNTPANAETINTLKATEAQLERNYNYARAEAAKFAQNRKAVETEKGRKSPVKGMQPEDVSLRFQTQTGAPEVALTRDAIDALENNDLSSALEDLAKVSNNDVIRAASGIMKRLLENTQVQIISNLKDQNGNPVYGAASTDGKVVWFDRDFGFNEETLAHESTHAATERVIQTPEDQLTSDQLLAKRELEKLFAAAKASPDITSENAKSSLSEYVAEAFSNGVLQNQLRAKAWTLGDMWKAFKKTILNMLGVKTPTNMLDATLAAAETLFSKPARYTTADATLAKPSNFRKVAYANPGLARAGEIGDTFIAKDRSTLDRVRAASGGFLGMETMLVDRFAGFERLSKTMEALKGSQMMYYLRMYDQRMNFVSQAVSNGALQIVEKTRPDGRKEFLVESKSGPSIAGVVNILKDSPAGSADAANRLFTLYLAANRAKNKGIETLHFGTALTQADLNEAMTAIRATPGLEENFKLAQKEYNDYNRGLIGFLVQTGAVGKDVANRLMAENDYIPFYRERGGLAELVIGNEPPIRIGSIAEQPYLKELVGGDKPILDFMTSSVQNTNLLADMGLRNLATKNAVFELVNMDLAKIGAGRGTAGPDVVRFKVDGEDRFALIDTDKAGIPADILVKGMEGIPTQLPAAFRLLGMPATLLRKAVTLSPLYAAKQLFRDSLAAPLLAGADFVPVLGALKEVGASSTKKLLEQRGITGGQIFTGTQADLTKILKDLAENKTVSWGSLIAKAEAINMEADASTRRAQYNSYIRQGLSEMEATLMSLESMNFNKRGASPSIHALNSLIPFFNAQIQSLNVLYKAITGKLPFNERLKIQEKLLTRGLMLAAGTLAYAAAMQDDEAYKNATPEQKYGNWFIRIPGVDEPIRLPIPFEIGYIFKALPEALYNTMVDKHGGEEAVKAFRTILLSTIPGGSSYGIPQALKPAIEAGLGKSFYTGRDILSRREQTLLPEQQFRENTSELAKAFGSLGISPIKVDALINGYTGTMGLAFAQAVGTLMPTRTAPEQAYKRLSEMPVVGGAFQPNDAGGIINNVYEHMLEFKKVKVTVDDMIKRGDMAGARELISTRSNEFAASQMADQFVTTMGKLTQYEQAIRASNNTPEQKREQLDKIRQAKIRFSEMTRQATDRTIPQ